MSFEGKTFSLYCGMKSNILGLSDDLLSLSVIPENISVKGLVGNTILNNRTIGYFPRRNAITLCYNF